MPFLRCKLLKYIDIPAATNSSKAEVARSNRAGQAIHKVLTMCRVVQKYQPSGWFFWIVTLSN